MAVSPYAWKHHRQQKRWVAVGHRAPRRPCRRAEHAAYPEVGQHASCRPHIWCPGTSKFASFWMATSAPHDRCSVEIEVEYTADPNQHRLFCLRTVGADVKVSPSVCTELFSTGRKLSYCRPNTVTEVSVEVCSARHMHGGIANTFVRTRSCERVRANARQHSHGTKVKRGRQVVDHVHCEGGSRKDMVDFLAGSSHVICRRGWPRRRRLCRPAWNSSRRSRS